MPRLVARERGTSQVHGARTRAFPSPLDMTLSAPSAGLTDLELLSRLIAGDERALGTLYDRHGAMSFALASAIVGDSADAEEVVAESFAQMWRNATTFDRTRGSVVAWVSTIVRSRSLDLLRARRRRARMLDEAAAMSDEGASPALSTGSPSPDRDVELNEAQRLVRRSLDELPAPQRLCLELAYFGGLSQSEIAERLSEPLGTVKTRMRAGMDKLRSSLKPLMGDKS
jgi:RNA polymerase sigma-70 factor, ECF subfamily